MPTRPTLNYRPAPDEHDDAPLVSKCAAALGVVTLLLAILLLAVHKSYFYMPYFTGLGMLVPAAIGLICAAIGSQRGDGRGRAATLNTLGFLGNGLALIVCAGVAYWHHEQMMCCGP